MIIYRKLSLRDRCLIKNGIDNRYKISDIAKSLDRNRSVINREINKNGGLMWYDPIKAHEKSQISNRSGYNKIDRNKLLQDYIRKQINIKWSPVVIAGKWNLEHKDMKISAESIYSWIYSKPMIGEKLYILLPRRKKKRGMVIRKSINQNSNKKLISMRPEEINNRERIGDWEADLIFQQGNQSANMLTAIDRKSRFIAIIKHDSKNSEAITLSIKKIVEKHKVNTLTVDNGTEFSQHADYPVDTYFCNPGSPWQKASIEHLNGMVRRRIDYRIPISDITQDQIDRIVEDLNNMPRKILGFRTPFEVMNESRVKLASPAIEAFL